MKRWKVVSITVFGGVVLAAGAIIPLVSRAYRIAVDNARLQTLRSIGTTLQLYADTRTNGDIDSVSLLEHVRRESPRLLSPRDFGDGRIVTYEWISPKETRRGDPSKLVVVRDHIEADEHRSAALFADGHVAFDE